MMDPPLFPVIVQRIAESPGKRTLIPMGSEEDVHQENHVFNWLADGDYRIIDSQRWVYVAEPGIESEYDFKWTGKVLSDSDIRDLMVENLRSLRKSVKKYLRSVESMSGAVLFQQTYKLALKLPELSIALWLRIWLLVLGLPIAVILGIAWIVDRLVT